MLTKKQFKELKYLIRKRAISVVIGKSDFDSLYSLSQEQADKLIGFLRDDWNQLSGLDFCSRVRELQTFFKFGVPVDRWRLENGYK